MLERVLLVMFGCRSRNATSSLSESSLTLLDCKYRTVPEPARTWGRTRCIMASLYAFGGRKKQWPGKASRYPGAVGTWTRVESGLLYWSLAPAQGTLHFVVHGLCSRNAIIETCGLMECLKNDHIVWHFDNDDWEWL